ncbi:MAG: hypothetical protein ACYCWW_14740 [Deltaproteobacteria bacterium]
MMSDGLYRVLRFLGHELGRGLEHVDLRLEGVDELEGEERELALEVGLALLEGLEYGRGYLLEPFAVLGRFELELAQLPTPAGRRTVAALSFVPAPGMARPLGLPPRARLYFDGAYGYLVERGAARLWAEVSAEGPRDPSRPRLPIVD